MYIKLPSIKEQRNNNINKNERKYNEPIGSRRGGKGCSLRVKGGCCGLTV